MGAEAVTEVEQDGTVPTGDLLTAYVAAQLTRIREYGGPVRDDAEDAVHQMRVATRRLRSLLATYRPVVEPHAAELVLGPVTRRIETAMTQRCDRARTAVREALDSERYPALLDTLDTFVRKPPLTARAEEPAADVLPELLARDWKRMRRRSRDVATADPSGRDHAMHEMRKAAKRMRYAAELATPALGGPWPQVASRSEEVQELLGEHQDTVVSRRALREIGMQAHLSGENGFTFGRLHALEQARAAEVERSYDDLVGSRLPKKPRRWATPGVTRPGESSRNGHP